MSTRKTLAEQNYGKVLNSRRNELKMVGQLGYKQLNKTPTISSKRANNNVSRRMAELSVISGPSVKNLAKKINVNATRKRGPAYKVPMPNKKWLMR